MGEDREMHHPRPVPTHWDGTAIANHPQRSARRIDLSSKGRLQWDAMLSF